MEKIFLKDVSFFSSIKDDSKKYITVLNSYLFKHLENREFGERCLSEKENGINELHKMLDDIRRIIFSKEDLVRWLYKVKEDANKEVDRILIDHEASLGGDPAKINFERIGFLIGIFEETERYLTMLTAIEPSDTNKAHYSILDQLDALDEFYINTDNIPGYYDVQKSKKIKKQKYQLKNLDDSWNEYLALKDTNNVSEEFGDIKYHLNDYHGEFKWELIHIRPREDIKQYLDFHYKKYNGANIDFLNHIEYRIMPVLSGYARSDYQIYQLIIKEWLKNKRSVKNENDNRFLVDTLISVTSTFLDSVYLHKKTPSEDNYNLIIKGLLKQAIEHRSWSVNEESKGGTTDSPSKAFNAGISSRDFIILNEKQQHISAIECLRLKSVPTDIDKESYIQSHVQKIFRNEPIGISPLFIISYCETQEFSRTWDKYVDYISRIDFGKYQHIECERDLKISPSRANLKLAKVTHLRETNEIEVFHIFINMNP
ncbi:MAG: hypothetical protein HOO86_10770 [Bacteroidales bacterium]|nr:hypothetical protein [Bacteroidales bacterium]